MTPPIPVPRFGHGSRVPGWDDAVDLTKPPAEVPDPATTPVPEEYKQRRSRTAMARITRTGARRRSRRCHAAPGAITATARPRLIDQVAAVMALHPALLTSVATFYDLLETVPPAAPPTTYVYVLPQYLLAARGQSELFDAMVGAAAGERRLCTSARLSAWGRAISPRWRRSMASTWGHWSTPTASGSWPTCTPAAQSCATSSSATGAASIRSSGRSLQFGPHADAARADHRQLSAADEATDRPGPSPDEEQRRSSRRPSRRATSHEEDPVQQHRRARPQHARGLRTARRL